MINDMVQTPTAYWKFKLSLGDSESVRHDPNMNCKSYKLENYGAIIFAFVTDICVPTTVEFKKKIISSLETLLLPCQCVLVQYWAAKEIGNTIVLTTTCQPFGLTGNNKALQSYREACLDHKLYVHPMKGVAFGLAGRVFLNRAAEQTQNVHRYPKDQRPPCEDVIFTEIWGSFAVPVIDTNGCVGVLEFVMDTSKNSYDIDIGLVYRALEHAGFQSSIQTDRSGRTCNNCRKRIRRTPSFSITSYSRLVPYFGLSSADAAAKLGVKTGTFRNACRNVGIPEWPWISNNTNTRASSHPESQNSPTTSETSSFATPIATEYIPSWDTGIFEWSCVQAMTTPASVSEYQISQMPFDNGYYGTLTATEYDSFGSPANTSSFGAQMATECMESETSSFGTPVATGHTLDLSSLIPIWYADDFEWSHTQCTSTETSLSENQINQIAHGTSNEESWIESERARANFMQNFDEMEYDGIMEDLHPDMVTLWFRTMDQPLLKRRKN
ncbi:uncharacterized protein LOC143601517 [Bidens hawaiensis]|uniref:uncharacterized protein LOC143601517 n=1 Tax=Bidens hawaiensis TaxID=980011 RepID=UPI00404B0F50